MQSSLFVFAVSLLVEGKLCELEIPLFINFPKCVRSIVRKNETRIETNVSVTVRESDMRYMLHV